MYKIAASANSYQINTRNKNNVTIHFQIIWYIYDHELVSIKVICIDSKYNFENSLVFKHYMTSGLSKLWTLRKIHLKDLILYANYNQCDAQRISFRWKLLFIWVFEFTIDDSYFWRIFQPIESEGLKFISTNDVDLDFDVSGLLSAVDGLEFEDFDSGSGETWDDLDKLDKGRFIRLLLKKRIQKTRSIRRTQTPPCLWPLTCDRDLLTRSSPLRFFFLKI